MNDNELELQRLMNAEMDGVATAAESVRLRSILETQPAARSQFGSPDEVTGSGLLIYKYRLGGGRTLWLGFPGEAAIIYARLESENGTFSDLPLR